MFLFPLDLQALNSATREAQAQQVLDFSRNFGLSQSADVSFLVGDMNSSPNSPVYNKITAEGFSDALATIVGDNAVADTSYATWGAADNTWTGPGGAFNDGYTLRLDYIFYKTLKSQVSITGVSDSYKTLELKTTSGGSMISLSDHSFVEASFVFKNSSTTAMFSVSLVVHVE